MNPIKLGKVFAVVFLLTQALFAQNTITVPGDYKTIQAAVNAAKTNDTIKISGGTYKEQVTIDSTKDGLTLIGDPDDKPIIVYQDTKARFPKDCAEAQDEALSDKAEEDGLYYEQCGALRILRARRVTIENIKVDGGGAVPFGKASVWCDPGCSGDCYPLFHGNAGITLVIAGDITIRNCDIFNAYFGINIKDRNEQGVFANPNPADISLGRIVPLAGFGKTGNHIIENNRIHNNSWGMFFESTWDLGSNIRNNLIYSNYHQTPAIASKVEGLPEGGNQVGGGMLFKDDPLSPMAIYNNTFWDNTMSIVAQWQAGAYHLIFNNIFSKPHVYGESEAQYSLEKTFSSRFKHNLYASQVQKPSANDARIDNNLSVQRSGNTYEQGNLVVLQGQTTSAMGTENRWLETQDYFESTDEDDPDFLTPKWGDPMVDEFIVDAGWPEGGIRDADGSIADIGAISKDGMPEVSIGIKAINPVIINNGIATLSFNVYPIAGELTDMKVKYVQWMGDLPRDTDGWGNNVNSGTKLNENKPASIQPLSGGQSISMGINNLTFNVKQTGMYAFMEMVIEGTNSYGDTVTTNVGFLPYRELNYMFSIRLYEKGTDNEITKARVGELVDVHIVPLNKDSSKIKTGEVVDVKLNLVSAESFKDGTNTTKEMFINNISVKDGIRKTISFTKLPSTGIGEVLAASGTYRLDSQLDGEIIMGNSKEVKILPGYPAKIKFKFPRTVQDTVDDRSVMDVLNRNVVESAKLQIYDENENPAVDPAKVTLKSLDPEIGGPVDGTGKPVTSLTITSDTLGIALFDSIKVNKGGEGDLVKLRAYLYWDNRIVDSTIAYFVVGNLTDQFSVFYENNRGKIDTCSGERVPVTVRATLIDDGTTIEFRNNEFKILFDKNGLAAYESEDATTPITKSKLVDGEALIWIGTSVREIENAQITISPIGDNTIAEGKGSNINFRYCNNQVKSAFYFADNGNGSVNRIEVTFRDVLDETNMPDSMKFYWPDLDAHNVRVIKKEQMKVDTADARKMVFVLKEPFDSLTTVSSDTLLGECIYFDAAFDLEPNVKRFDVKEKVGPLLMSAVVVERIEKEKNDIINLTFSEPVSPASLKDSSLILIKGSTSYVLNVVKSNSLDSIFTRYKVEVTNIGEDKAPKEGDSLRINPEGKTKDMADGTPNFAHKENRPVIIALQEIPPEIDTAFYYDKEGNGVVDTVVIEFKKTVKIENIERVELTLDGKKVEIKKGFSQGENVTKVAFNVAEFMGTNIKTSVRMYLKFYYKNADSAQVVDVTDKAAPVITKAVYRPGAVNDDEELPDTLEVTFSEKVNAPSVSKEEPRPFISNRKSLGEYKMTLECLRESGNTESTVSFLVKEFDLSKIKIAETGDSIRIRSGNYCSDNSGNWQNIKKNRIVPIEVKSLPIKFKVEVGPNPFLADGVNFITIRINPQTKILENTAPEGRIKIYDALGSIVCDAPVTLKKNVMEYKWDGRNLKGRFVGSGTYLAVVEAKDTKSGQKMESPASKTIGVKR